MKPKSPKRSAAGKIGWSSRTPKQQRAFQSAGVKAARERFRTMTPEEKRRMQESKAKAWAEKDPKEIARVRKAERDAQKKRWKKMTKRARSAFIKSVWGSMPEQARKERGKKAAATRLKTQEPSARRHTAATKQKIGKAIKNWWKRFTPEQRKKINAQRWANLTPTKISAARRKAWTNLTPEQRRERGLNQAAGVSPASRRAGLEKAWKTRKIKLLGNLGYFDNLPILKLLSPIEMQQKIEELQPLLESLFLKFQRRRDYEEVQSEVNFAAIVALAKWDRQMDLPELVNASVKLHLIKYFGGLKKGWGKRKSLAHLT